MDEKGEEGEEGDEMDERNEAKPIIPEARATRMILAMIAEIDGAYCLSPGGRHHTDDDGKIFDMRVIQAGPATRRHAPTHMDPPASTDRSPAITARIPLV